MTIMRGVITFTFMFDTNIDPLKDVEHNLSLEDILDECSTGHMLGATTGATFEAIPDADVPDAERALGCTTGDFFADPDELAHAQMDAALDNAAEDER